MRIGLIGYGFIGARIHERIAQTPGPFELAFVHSRTRPKLRDVPSHQILDDLGDAMRFGADLIVETASPEVTRQHGAQLVRAACYMPLSLTALVDDALRDHLVGEARAAGTSLLIAHGALVGMDSLIEWRSMWDEVSIGFRKPPQSLGLDPNGIDGPTLLFEGTVRDAARRFPRNVNAMVACALATVGLDRCRAEVVADPGIDQLELTLSATGRDGTRLSIQRRQPAVGVSGSEMFEAVYRSILRASGRLGAMDFV